MVWLNWQIFTERWMKRAKRNRVYVDYGDKFISLWIAFNGWLRGKYGESISDRDQINRVKREVDLSNIFCELKNHNRNYASKLQSLQRTTVIDMRDPENDSGLIQYDGSFESFIEVIYRIRCNLFHGRKDVEADKKDYELVTMAYFLLHALFDRYLKKIVYGEIT